MKIQSNRRWTAEDFALLGEKPDSILEKLTGLSRRKIAMIRWMMCIPLKTKARIIRKYRWSSHRISLLGTAKDREVAKRLGIHEAAVMRQRKKYGIPRHIKKMVKSSDSADEKTTQEH